VINAFGVFGRYFGCGCLAVGLIFQKKTNRGQKLQKQLAETQERSEWIITKYYYQDLTLFVLSQMAEQRIIW
jgi:coproporphyrinogen III oxidase-like Fe-S oxidoreductase